jgi:CDP-glycerol glycerophosphotransferase
VLEENDAAMLVRSHPLGAGDYAPPFDTDRVRPLGSDLLPDVTPVLPGIDALITDYSSLAFDAALVPLPVVYLAPDLDEYARRRGFYGTYAEVAGDGWAEDWTGAAAQLAAVLASDAERQRRRDRSAALSSRIHAFRDGGNTRRVYRAILAGIEADTRRPKGHR